MFALVLILLSSFIGISKTLPETSYIKMIDIWMIVAMMSLFFEVSLHTAKAALSKWKMSTKGEDKLKKCQPFPQWFKCIPRTRTDNWEEMKCKHLPPVRWIPHPFHLTGGL